MADLAKKYYDEGIRIHLVIVVTYEKEFTDEPSRGPKPVPPEVAAQPHFLDQYNLVVRDMAKLGEKYQVEIFTPMNEPDLALGRDIGSDWGQTILPIVKNEYHGKVLYKAALINTEQTRLNFTGYDVIGITTTPGGEEEKRSFGGYPAQVAQKLATVSGWAKQDKVKEIIFAEFGTWGEAEQFSDEGKATAHRIVFEQGKDKVTGFIVFDSPALGSSIANTRALEEVTYWFRSGLGN